MEITEEIKSLPEFDDHKKIFRMEDLNTGLLGFVAIHRIHGKNPSLGATRFWRYQDEAEALRDALRLSRLMSYKSAAAGLPYGGAKAVIMIRDENTGKREELFKEYARQVNNLQGSFVTGSDVGVSKQDLEVMSLASPYIIGTDINAGYYTALGVFYAIKKTLKQITGEEDLAGRSFAIQGMGKTGLELLDLLYSQVRRIFVADINSDVLNELIIKYPDITIVNSSDIHKQAVDIFCPCALSHSINEQTIGELNCRGIVGSANNQLSKAELGESLLAKGIVYAPDYVANGGGLISVVDEFKNGNHQDSRIKEALLQIPRALELIFGESNKLGLSTVVIADELASKVFNNY
ncbi:hypothetical protein KJ641_01455 [Patescibacteria group bacterium]|nr:hypothetical protein [Patescibacteria group bacterium]